MTRALHAIAFPLAFDTATRGLQDTTDLDRYVVEAIHQVLLTAPGERTHRPDFGAGLLRVVFQPWSEASPALVRTIVYDSLTRWLGDLLEVLDVVVTHEDAEVRVEVRYRVRTGEREASTELVVPR